MLSASIYAFAANRTPKNLNRIVVLQSCPPSRKTCRNTNGRNAMTQSLERVPVFTTRAPPVASGEFAAARRSNIAIYTFGSLGGFLFGYYSGVICGALLFIRQEFALRPFQQGLVVSSL